MEINITKYFTNNLEPSNYSASRMEKGNNAGTITWNAAMSGGAELMLLDTPVKIEALKAAMISAGMDEEEIEEMTDIESNALFLQLISGDIREDSEYLQQDPIDWVGYEKDGNTIGHICQGDENTVYYYLGS